MTLESPLDRKEIKPVNPQWDQSWIFTGRPDNEAEGLILWPPHVKNWPTGKEPDTGKDWRQVEKGSDRGLDCWMSSSTQWTWVWASSGRGQRTGKPRVLQSIVSQRLGHDLKTEEQQQRDNIIMLTFPEFCDFNLLELGTLSTFASFSADFSSAQVP